MNCPNLGVDCDYPDCTMLDPDCARANVVDATPPVRFALVTPAQPCCGADYPTHLDTCAHYAPPLMADDIFGKKTE